MLPKPATELLQTVARTLSSFAVIEFLVPADPPDSMKIIVLKDVTPV
jgi:hypothetical protein